MDNTQQQPEALRLADRVLAEDIGNSELADALSDELRRQHAEIERMRRALHDIAEDVARMNDNDITFIVGWPTEPEMVKFRQVAAAAAAAERVRCTRRAADIAIACCSMYENNGDRAVCEQVAYELGRAPL